MPTKAITTITKKREAIKKKRKLTPLQQKNNASSAKAAKGKGKSGKAKATAGKKKKSDAPVKKKATVATRQKKGVMLVYDSAESSFAYESGIDEDEDDKSSSTDEVAHLVAKKPKGRGKGGKVIKCSQKNKVKKKKVSILCYINSC